MAIGLYNSLHVACTCICAAGLGIAIVKAAAIVVMCSIENCVHAFSTVACSCAAGLIVAVASVLLVGSGRVKTWSAERLDHDHCHWSWSGCGRVVVVTMVNSNKFIYRCNYLYLYKGERDERPGDSGRATDPNRTERDYMVDQSATLTSLYLPGQPVLVP
jgi:hypothetical protein